MSAAPPTPAANATPAPPRAAARAKRRPAKPACRHCGAPLLDARAEQSGFCCPGCAYVFRLVHEHGLDGYYRVKDDITAPADAAVFQPRDFAWLTAAQRAAEESAGPRSPELTLGIQGISCAGCVWLIERLFQTQPGARDIFANAQLGHVRLRWLPGEFSAADFAIKLQSFGYLLGPLGEVPEELESRGLVRRIGLCAAFAMNVMLFTLPVYFGMERTFAYASLFSLLSLVFGTLSFLVGGIYFLGRAVRALREDVLHIDLPISLGVLGAYLGSLYGWLTGREGFVYFDFVATFILLMLIGRWAQVAAVERNRRQLLRHQPLPARLRALTADGTTADVAPEQLAAGQIFFLGAGQTAPVDSSLESAVAEFSLASINGEAEPRLFAAGQRVPAGAVNVSRAELRLLARQTWNESLLAQLTRPVEPSGSRHLLLEKIIRGYLIGIIALAVLAGLGWWFATHDLLRVGTVVTAVLVVSCPCAIGLAFPLADEIATVALRRRGVFVLAEDLWARLHRVRQLVFDKTGTLTLETPVLQNPAVLATLAPDALAALHALVRDNPHPVCLALLQQLLVTGAPPALPGEAGETVGCGLELAGWSLGRPGWRAQSDSADLPAGTSETFFARHGEIVARFRFHDTVRPDALREIHALTARGFAVQILSGDRHEKVAALASDLGLPPSSAAGELSPQQKATWFDRHDQRDTLMLGDGANDSLAFDRALCRGTPVIHRGLLEQKADFYYLGRGISGVRALFEINRIRRHTQFAILVFSIVYNAIAVGLAAAGMMNPLVAAILMPVNSLLTLFIVTGGMRSAFRAT